MQATDTSTTVGARASHIQDRLLSAEQMLDACPNGAMPCATA
jgi:hypothetical protein